jgi:hypothetical protein
LRRQSNTSCLDTEGEDPPDRSHRGGQKKKKRKKKKKKKKEKTFLEGQRASIAPRKVSQE